jgi:hypothetical protein
MGAERRRYQVERATWVPQLARDSLIISSARSTRVELVPAKALGALIPIILSVPLTGL